MDHCYIFPLAADNSYSELTEAKQRTEQILMKTYTKIDAKIDALISRASADRQIAETSKTENRRDLHLTEALKNEKEASRLLSARDLLND